MTEGRQHPSHPWPKVFNAVFPGLGLSVWSRTPDRGRVPRRRPAATDRNAERGHHPFTLSNASPLGRAVRSHRRTSLPNRHHRLPPQAALRASKLRLRGAHHDPRPCQHAGHGFALPASAQSLLPPRHPVSARWRDSSANSPSPLASTAVEPARLALPPANPSAPAPGGPKPPYSPTLTGPPVALLTPKSPPQNLAHPCSPSKSPQSNRLSDDDTPTCEIAATACLVFDKDCVSLLRWSEKPAAGVAQWLERRSHNP